MARQKYTPKQVADALTKSKGMVYVAARNLGCAANTIYNYAERYAIVQEVIDQERGMMIDTAEIALWKALQNSEAWAVSLVLKTIGKNRGYVERQELTGKDGEKLQPTIYLPSIADDSGTPTSS